MITKSVSLSTSQNDFESTFVAEKKTHQKFSCLAYSVGKYRMNVSKNKLWKEKKETKVQKWNDKTIEVAKREL